MNAPLFDRRYSRRTVLRAGVLGAAAISLGETADARALTARSRPRAAPAPGLYGLNQDWLFGGRYVTGAELPSHPEAGFVGVTLPHTVSSMSWGDWDPSTWEDVWIYRRHLDGSALLGARVFVDFQGVMTNASVYLGGVLLAQHEGGYLPWSVELTQGLVPGDNVLAVVVDARWLDVPPDAGAADATGIDYLQPGGIHRDVALRVTPPVLVADVFARTVNVLSGAPSVDVEVTVDAADLPSEPVLLTATVLDGTQQVGTASGTLSVTQLGQSSTTLTVGPLSGISLWSPATPKLYSVQVTAAVQGADHTAAVRIGFREATFQVDGFYLNGERLEIFGVNRHGLFPYAGMAAPERLDRRDAELLRNTLRCNMVRCSHYPQSPHFLDACDELGLMVWEEPPGWQHIGDDASQALVTENVRDMVRRDRNRPSLIVWATRINESANDPTLYTLTRAIADSMDGTRPTTGAMRTQSTDGWAQDVFAYNDYHTSGGAATLEPPVPGVPYMVSEAVGAVDGAPLYRWVDSSSTLALQTVLHAQVHNLARGNSAYAGLLAWAAVDYASLVGGARVWHNLKWAGVLDSFRVPKFAAGFYASQVDPATAPIIAPAFFWDFGPSSPPEGPGAGSLIATNCEHLELYLNGQLLTTGDPDTAAYPNLAHPPVSVDLTVNGTTQPELQIDGYVGGQVVASLKMSSNPASDRLALTVEDSSILGDGTDATRFTLRALDAYGNQRPYPSGDVTLALDGPGTLVADNPFPFAEYGGVGGGYIRSQPGTSGAVTVYASHPTLGNATATVTIVAAPSAGVSGATGTALPLMNTLQQPTPAQVEAALLAVLLPPPRDTHIRRLRRHHGYTFTFAAPFAGSLELEWRYRVPWSRHHRHRRRHFHRIALATASSDLLGQVPVELRINHRGRRLLKHSRGAWVQVRASFTPAGGQTVTVSREIRLSR